MTPLPDIQPIVRLVGSILLASLWVNLLIAISLSAVLWLLRRSRPELRYVASCAALVSMLAAPIAIGILGGPNTVRPTTVMTTAVVPMPTAGRPDKVRPTTGVNTAGRIDPSLADGRAVACGDAVTYVEALTELEKLRADVPTLAVAATGGSLLQRVRRLLDPRFADATGQGWAAIAGLTIVLAALALCFAEPAKASGDLAIGRSGDLLAESPKSVIQSPSRQIAHSPNYQRPPAPPEPPTLPKPATPPAPPAPPTPVEVQAPPAPPAPPVPPAPPAPPTPPAPPEPPEPPEPPVQRGERGEFNISHSDDTSRLSIQGKGEITFTDDDSDVASLSDNGYLMIDVRNAEGRRRVEIEARRGTIERRFYVEGRERPWDQEARTWLAKTLPDVIRQTGIGAKARVKRIVGRQGPTGVLDEVSKIRSGYVKRVYLTALMDAAALDSATWQRLFRDAGRQMSSDYELTQVVMAGMSRQPDAAARLAAIDALTSVSSDYEQRRALTAIVKAGPLTPALVRAMLQSARTIGSDYEQRNFLQQLVAAGGLDTSTAAEFFGAVRTMRSDYERRRVLMAVLSGRDTSEPVLKEVLSSAAVMSSDFERAQVLLEIVNRHGVSESLKPSFVSTVDRMRSDHEHRRIMTAMQRGRR